MKPRQTTKTGASKDPQTTANSVVGAWLKNESQRQSNLSLVGDSDKISPERANFAKHLGQLLKEHDALLKYARLVVRCHEKHDFEENVNAIRSYLLEDLQIEP